MREMELALDLGLTCQANAFLNRRPVQQKQFLVGRCAQVPLANEHSDLTCPAKSHAADAIDWDLVRERRSQQIRSKRSFKLVLFFSY